MAETEDSALVSQKRRPLVWLALTAASVVLVAITTVLIANSSRQAPPAGPAPDISTSAPPHTRDSSGTLVVHEGDTVEASGQVIAAPGLPVKFCAPAVQPLPLPPPDTPPDCAFYVVTTGVDLQRLHDRELIAGAVSGTARLRGVYRDRTLAVTEQGPPVAPNSEDQPEFPLPCSEPPGGWRVVPGANTHRLHEYVEQHPDRFGNIWVTYPHGQPPAAQPNTLAPAVAEVFVVGVAQGDLEQVRRELEPLFDGNLCTARSPHSRATVTKVLEELRPFMEDQRNGIYQAGGAPERIRPVSVALVVLTPWHEEKLRAVSTELIEPRPWLRPAS